jgi:two-component system, OmpR family, KDP operon response regulator KdpE
MKAPDATPAPLLLLVEDDAQMRRFLRTTLSTHEYRILEAGTGKEALALAAAHTPDLIVLDLGLPDGDGIEVTRGLREWTKVPILVLSARAHDQDKVQALDAGADDYLTKPFSVPELLARLRVALRHAAMASTLEREPVLEFGDLRIDLAERRVQCAGVPVHLTRLEYKLLSSLVRHPGRVLTHAQLLREVWGPESQGQNHYVRVYMAHLRNKLETDPARPRRLLSEPGVGYRFQPEA